MPCTRNDEELNKLLAGVTIAQGGVLPNILARLSSLPEAVRGKAHPTRAIVIFNLYYYLPNERHHKCLPNERHIYCCPMIRHCHDLIANLFPDHCSTLNKPESFQGVFRLLSLLIVNPAAAASTGHPLSLHHRQLLLLNQIFLSLMSWLTFSSLTPPTWPWLTGTVTGCQSSDCRRMTLPM